MKLEIFRDRLIHFIRKVVYGKKKKKFKQRCSEERCSIKTDLVE